ncbi:MAG: hypothetical protein ABJE66_04515 [Deltaproteobacteria bacterium]
MTTLFGARIALHGATPLYDRKNLERVLDVLEARGLVPQKAGLDERERKPYDRAATTGRLAEPPTPFRQTQMYLWRTAALKYEASLALWDSAYVGFDFKPTPPASDWARIFDLADALAECFQPDWGAAGIRFDLRDDLKRAPAQGDELDADLMHSATAVFPVDYVSAGPLGLGPRTYIGSFFADQLGRDRIESLPLVVDKLAWGGYRIDLVAEPWAAEIPALLEAWRRGMAHLRDANVLATPVFDLGHVGGWKRGTNMRRRTDR